MLRKISREQLKENIRFSAPVFFDDGTYMLVNEGIPIRRRELDALVRWDIPYVLTSGKELQENETLDEAMISQSPSFIKYLVETLDQHGIPMVTPPGVLGAHVDAMTFCKHIPQTEYPAGALAAAFYLVSGVRGMERGTISSVRDENGVEILADVELLRLAVPRRVFTLSQVKYVVDRLVWLYENREMIGGLRFTYEPPVLRFFMGGLEPTSDWPEKLMLKFRKDFGDSL